MPSYAYDPVPSRSCHRISAIFPIDDGRRVAAQFSVDFAGHGTSVSDAFSLDRLKPFYKMAQGQLPRVLERIDLAQGELCFERAEVPIEEARLWVFALPHGAYVLAVTVEVSCPLLECIGVLEDFHHRRFTVCDDDVWLGCTRKMEGRTFDEASSYLLGPDTYQLVFTDSKSQGAPTTAQKQTISSLIYRYAGVYSDSHETARVLYPPETNRGAGIAATGPYVGVVSGLQGYIENAIYVSALQFMGSVALLREIRLEAFEELVRLRRLTAEQELSLRTRRNILSEMARQLGHLRLELSFGVEAFDRIASLVPSLRVIDFHAALYESAELAREAETVSSMLERLEQGLRSEIEKLQAEERSSDERRRQVTSTGLGLVSAIAVPLGLLFAFFGVNATEVDPRASIFSLDKYEAAYFGLAGIFLLAAVVAITLCVAFWRSDRVTERLSKDFLS